MTTTSRTSTLLEVIGAAWVVWLGVQAIRHRGDARAALELGGPTERTSAALRIVFFVTFLPQFTHASAGHLGVQIALWGLFFVAASRAREWFAHTPQRLDAMGTAGGVMMIGLGAWLATGE